MNAFTISRTSSWAPGKYAPTLHTCHSSPAHTHTHAPQYSCKCNQLVSYTYNITLVLFTWLVCKSYPCRKSDLILTNGSANCQVCVCALTSHSANSTAVHTLFTCSKANGLVLSYDCSFNGLQDHHFLPGDVCAWWRSQVMCKYIYFHDTQINSQYLVLPNDC